MILLLIRNWRLILDCVIVIAIILAFTFWDPFNIFNTRKLRQTATIVTGVRDIGELVTAEFYGEVISSLKEIELTEPPEDQLQILSEDIYLQFKRTFATIKRPQVDGKAVTDNLNLQEKETYSKFIAFLGTRYLKRGLNRIYDEDKKQIKGNLEKVILKRLYDEVHEMRRRLDKEKIDENQFDQYLDSIPPFLGEFNEFHSMLTKKDVMEGPDRKKNIVFIGRGWVKAGFRFDKFDDNNFVYDKVNKVVHFYGLEPVILDKDINPWFIPERKIKGFELVNYSPGLSFQDAKDVKKRCKEKLLEQAGKEILIRAEENGKEALKNFFSLILDEPALRIELHDMPYEKDFEAIASDTTITISEALAINRLYLEKKKEIADTPGDVKMSMARQLVQFISRLKKLPFINDHYRFSFYSMAAAKILADTFRVDSADLRLLLAQRSILKPQRDSLNLTTTTVHDDSLWFQNGNFIAEFHDALHAIFKEGMLQKGVHSDTGTLFLSHDSVKVVKGEKVVLWKKIKENDKDTYLYFLEKDLKKDLYFPGDFAYDLPGVLSDTMKIGQLKFPEKKVYNEELLKIRQKEIEVITAVVKVKEKKRGPR